MRIIESDKAFRKSYKYSFTDDFFKIKRIPTLIPPTYSLRDSDGETIKNKPKVQLVCLPLEKNVTKTLSRWVCNASLCINFNRNIWLKHSCIFFNDEVQLSGDRRFALSAKIFPTKNENIVDVNITMYILKIIMKILMSSLGLTTDKIWPSCPQFLIQWSIFLQQLNVQRGFLIFSLENWRRQVDTNTCLEKMKV